jgi:general secretion pathway protein M
VKLTRASLSLDALAALPLRERRLVIIGLAGAALLFIFAVLLPLDRSVAHAQARLVQKRADLAWMQEMAPVLAALGPAPATTGEPLLVIIDRSARESGLASALTTEPAGPGSLSVRLQKAPFDSMIAWLARLAQQKGVSVESATIERADAAGLVNAALVLHAS